MHFGITIPNNFGVEAASELVQFAVWAEQQGYESAWVSDHLFHAEYVAARLGDKPYHEPLTVLTAIAASTRRLGLGTSVLVLPWHHPVRLAKTIATLDNLSGGRVNLGVGVGITEDEYAALGVPFKQRGRIANEYLGAMRALWTQSVPAFHGQHLDFEGLQFEPKPTQKPHPPIWIGGNSPAAFRRVVEFGQGWHPLGLSPAALAEAGAGLAKALGDAGREAQVPIAVRLLLNLDGDASSRPADQQKTLKGPPEAVAEVLHAFANAGVTHVLLDTASNDLATARSSLERFREAVLPLLD